MTEQATAARQDLEKRFIISGLVPPAKAAEYLQTTTGTLAVWRCLKRYPLRYVRIGRRIFYRLEDIQRFIEMRTVSGITEASPNSKTTADRVKAKDRNRLSEGSQAEVRTRRSTLCSFLPL